MVNGPEGPRPRIFRISYLPPGGTSRESRDPQELQQHIEEKLARAGSELGMGNINEAAVSFSLVARMCMERARIGTRGAVGWYTRSIEPRSRAIALFHQVGREMDAALDQSFLGKAFSRLGVLRRYPELLKRAVFERTMAFELFCKLGQVKLQGEELSYLANDFRSLGWLEDDLRLKTYFFLKACGYSEASLQFFPRFLEGGELSKRKLFEKGYIALAKANAALCGKDKDEILSARDRCRSIAHQMGKHGSVPFGDLLIDCARELDKLLVLLSFEASS